MQDIYNNTSKDIVVVVFWMVGDLFCHTANIKIKIVWSCVNFIPLIAYSVPHELYVLKIMKWDICSFCVMFVIRMKISPR